MRDDNEYNLCLQFQLRADPDASEVLYLQSQDGNVYRAEDFNEDLDKSERLRDSELKLLRDIVPPQVPFVTEALGR